MKINSWIYHNCNNILTIFSYNFCLKSVPLKQFGNDTNAQSALNNKRWRLIPSRTVQMADIRQSWSAVRSGIMKGSITDGNNWKKSGLNIIIGVLPSHYLPPGRQDQIHSNGPDANSNRNSSVNVTTSSSKLVAMPFELNIVENEINFLGAIVS